MSSIQAIVGVGCDLIEIDRIKAAINKHPEGFLNKILLPSEIDYCHKFKDPYSRIAVRFAAKEAVSKALGTGIGAKLSFLDIEIAHDENKKPTVKLSQQALVNFGYPKFEISLSHTETLATAYVIAFH